MYYSLKQIKLIREEGFTNKFIRINNKTRIKRVNNFVAILLKTNMMKVVDISLEN